MVQKELNMLHESRDNFGRALIKMPLFRSAWLELLSLLCKNEKYNCFELITRFKGEDKWVPSTIVSKLALAERKFHKVVVCGAPKMN